MRRKWNNDKYQPIKHHDALDFPEKQQKCFTSNQTVRYQTVSYELWFFDLMRQNHKKILEQYLEKEGFVADVITDYMILDLVEYKKIIYYISIVMNSIREIDIKNRTYYIFNDRIIIKSIDPSTIRIVENSYKNILIYHISYATPNSVKPLCFIINKVNGYIDKYNGNRYLVLLDTDKDKDILKKVWRTMEKN